MNIIFFLGKPMQRIVAWAALPWLAKIPAPGCVQQAVGNARDLRHFRHVMDPHHVRPTQNAGGHRCGGGPKALLRECPVAPSRPGSAPKNPSGCGDPPGVTQPSQISQAPPTIISLLLD